MEGTEEVRLRDGSSCHDIRIKFQNDLLGQLKDGRRNTWTYRYAEKKHAGDRKTQSLLY